MFSDLFCTGTVCRLLIIKEMCASEFFFFFFLFATVLFGLSQSLKFCYHENVSRKKAIRERAFGSASEDCKRAVWGTESVTLRTQHCRQ